jgi:hypothetical protein
MGRNQKRVIAETLQTAQELGLNVSFNNFVNGEWLKDYATEITINGRSFKGLQSWDNTDFRAYLKLALIELATGEHVTGYNIPIKTVADVESYMKQSKTESTRNEQGHVEYAKDSYRWGKINIIDMFEQYQELDMAYKTYKFDDMETIEQYMDKLQSMQEFFKAYYTKMNKCNPNPNFWNAERLETFYITSNILPKFIREELKAEVSDTDMKTICDMYFKSRDEEVKTINSEMFADSLHRLIGDEKVKDDLLFKMGLV